MNWSDIPQRTQDGGYAIDVPWTCLVDHLQRYREKYNLDLCPDFQRGHVWSEAQRIAYLEAKLSGGIPMDVIRFNHPGWQRSFNGQMVCVDGLQRLTTALMFLQGEIGVFGGHTIHAFEGHVPTDIRFKVVINDLRSRAHVLRWYLELNSGGTPHTPEEIARVRDLLRANTPTNGLS